MKVENNTPFPAIVWENVDAYKIWHITTLVRIKYIFRESDRSGHWRLSLTPDQGDLFFQDVYFDDDENMPVRYESDFAAYKPNADIILNANAYTLGGYKKNAWDCGVEIKDARGDRLLFSTLRIMGEARWKRMPALGWVRNDVRAIDKLPVRYDKAYGGTLLDLTNSENGRLNYLAQDKNNPVGTGIRHRKMSETEYLEHQIEWGVNVERKSCPAGFGAINRSWEGRLVYAGTYDQQWLDEQHPYPPFDFDYRHNQAANPNLIMHGYVPLGSTFFLYNLFPGGGVHRFSIPELYCFADLYTKNDKSRRVLLNIDTVVVDIDHDCPGEWCVYLSYRGFHRRSPLLNGVSFHFLPKYLLR